MVVVCCKTLHLDVRRRREDDHSQAIQDPHLLPAPEMNSQVQQAMKEDCLCVSELLRQAIRLFMEEREWRRLERLRWLRSRQTTDRE